MAQLMASRLGTTSLDAYPQFAGGRLYAWICVIEFKSLVRNNFDQVGTYKKVFGSFGLMDVKRRGVGSAGARQAELAGLTVANVKTEPETQTPLLFVTKRTSSHCLKKSPAHGPL
jgi:hypothetical protein